jgi:hypothetical protein
MCGQRKNSNFTSTTVANKDKTMQQAVTSGGNPIPNQAKIKRAYDYIVVGSGAAGSIIAGELSKTGADILVVEAGGEDVGATVTDPSIWFYNVGGPLDWALPITPAPQLNNRRFNMALGRVVGGGSSVTPWCGRAAWSAITSVGSARARQVGASRKCCQRSRHRRIGRAARTIGVARAVLSAFARRVTRIPLLLPS